jgi:hypothetical protein
MALTISDVTGDIGGQVQVTFPALEAWFSTGRPFVQLTGAPGAAYLGMSVTTTLPDPPWYMTKKLYLAGTAAGGTMPVPSGTRLVGTAYYILDPPNIVLDHVTWEQDPITATIHVYKGPLWEYVTEDRTYNLPYHENGPFSATHSLHGALKACWGNRAGTCRSVVDADVVSDQSDPYVVTPEWAAEGGGTRDLGGFTLAIGIDGQPTTAVDDGVEVVSVTFQFTSGGTDEFELDGMDGIRVPAAGSTDGCHLEADANAMKFFVDDRDGVPNGGANEEAVFVAPVAVDDWLDGFRGGQQGYGQFLIAKPHRALVGGPDDVRTQVVASGYRARQVFWQFAVGDDTYGWRPWRITVAVSSTWATANDENVNEGEGHSPDLACTIDTHGTAIPRYVDPNDPNFVPAEPGLDGFVEVRRLASVSLQNPGGGAYHLSWAPDSAGLTVGQSGDEVTVNVAAGASNGHYQAAWADRSIAYDLTVPGLTALGMPQGYSRLVALAGEPVCNWENWPCGLALTLTSPRAVPNAWVRLTNLVPTSDDSCVANEDRILGYVSGLSVATVTYTIPFAIVAGTNVRHLIDLNEPAGRELQHVVQIEVGGLSGGGAAWQLKQTGVELVAFNPRTLAAAGRQLAKVQFNRLAYAWDADLQAWVSTDLPIHYHGLSLVAEGNRVAMPPSYVPILCDDRGLEFCHKLRTEAGLILDAMDPLRSWCNLLPWQQGWEARYSDADPLPCQQGHATFDAQFVAVEAGEYGGTYAMCSELMTGDVCEQVFDVVLTDGQWTSLPATLRNGSYEVLSGAVCPVRVRKFFEPSLHAQVADAAGERDLTNAAVELQERDGPGDASPIVRAMVNANDWGLATFSALPGFRENREGGLALAGGAPEAWYQGWNELRTWVAQVAVQQVCTCARVTCFSWGALGTHCRVWAQDATIKSSHSFDNTGTWINERELFVGCAPTNFVLPHGTGWLLYERAGDLVARSTDDAGMTWSEAMTAIEDRRCPTAHYDEVLARTLVLAYDPDAEQMEVWVSDQDNAASFDDGLHVVLGAADEACGHLVQLPGRGELVALWQYDGSIEQKTSLDGLTWA